MLTIESLGLGTGELLALTAAITWGIGTFIFGFINKKISSFNVTFLSTLPLLPLQIIVIFLIGDLSELYIFDLKILAIISTVTILTYVIGGTLYITSIKNAGVSIAASVTSIEPLYTFIFALFFLGEVITPIIILGTISIIAGISLLNIQKNGDETKRKNVRKGIIYAIIVAGLWAIGPVMLIPVFKHVSVFYVNMFRVAIQTIVMGTILISQKNFLSSFKMKTRDAVPIFLGGGLTGYVAVILFLTSIQTIGVSIATPISCTYPLFAFVLAMVFLKEEITRFKLIGIIAIVSGTILITI